MHDDTTADSLEVRDLSLQGFSLAGIETCLQVPELRLAVDVGRGRDDVVRCEHLALTHVHMDHAGGLPYLVAMRGMFGMISPRVYLHEAVAESTRAMLGSWDEMQRLESSFELVAMAPGDRTPLRRDYVLETFRTYHTVPSFGFSLIHRVDKLRPEYQGRPGTELGALRKQGVEITRRVESRVLSVTGDTLPEVLDKQPQILESETLLIECSFLDDRKPYEAVRRGAHVHLTDLMARADLLTCERVVLSHFSALYDTAEIVALLRPLADAIPGELWALPTAHGEPLRRIEKGSRSAL